MKRSVTIGLPVEQVWQLIVDRAAQQEWIGPGSVLRALDKSRLQLNTELGVWRTGFVTEVIENEQLECRLAPASTWPDGQKVTTLKITVAAKSANQSHVVAEESGNFDHSAKLRPLDDAVEFWESALGRLKLLASRIKARCGSPRQAVIVIHGIGQQEPGVTLKHFVKNVFIGREEEIESWSKPDRTSKILELRRITLKASEGQVRPRTEVYELYWAHMIRDTTLSQVGVWLTQLLFRWRVPSRFRLVWLGTWVAIILSIAATCMWYLGRHPPWFEYAFNGGIILLVLGVAWRFFGKPFVLGSIGDAVRYLTPRPANVEHRQAIREAGVELLDKLHQKGQFDRIVILGHSLGSVIAYDIITHYWARVHRHHLRLPNVKNSGPPIVERGLSEADAATAQESQLKAWKAARLNSQPWLVSDLVTIGSPLSMADFLMARTSEDFEKAKVNRELPTCPPVYELQGKMKRVSFEAGYDDRLGIKENITFSYFHHAAPFAVTRWTNLHFCNGLLQDPIGGPVAPQFGRWIRDIPLEPPQGRSFFLHSQYWSRAGKNKHIDALLEALDLDMGAQLQAEMAQHSPLMYLARDDS